MRADQINLHNFIQIEFKLLILGGNVYVSVFVYNILNCLLCVDGFCVQKKILKSSTYGLIANENAGLHFNGYFIQRIKVNCWYLPFRYYTHIILSIHYFH